MCDKSIDEIVNIAKEQVEIVAETNAKLRSKVTELEAENERLLESLKECVDWFDHTDVTESDEDERWAIRVAGKARKIIAASEEGERCVTL